jgi:ATP-dependent protease ClpP protease subunit
MISSGYVTEYTNRPHGAPGTPVYLNQPHAAVSRPAADLPTDPSRIALTGEVGRPGFTASALLNKLAASGGGPVTLSIDSRGGSTEEALRIVAVIHAHQQAGKGPVTAEVNGEASSAASMIVQACARRRVGPQARMLVHDPSTSWPSRDVSTGVTARDLLDACTTRQLPDGARPAAAMAISALRRTGDELAACYAWRSGRPASVWREAMAAERMYVGAGIVYAGLADEVTD